MDKVSKVENQFIMKANYVRTQREFLTFFDKPICGSQDQNEKRRNKKLNQRSALKTPQILSQQQIISGTVMIVKPKEIVFQYPQLEKEPESFVINLKRFNLDAQDPSSLSRTKLDQKVKFPCGKLKFTQIFHVGCRLRNKGDVKHKFYTLQAVFKHRKSALNSIFLIVATVQLIVVMKKIIIGIYMMIVKSQMQQLIKRKKKSQMETLTDCFIG